MPPIWVLVTGATGDTGRGDSFIVQHVKEVAIDHQNGVFEGTNDFVEKLGGSPSTSLEAFIEKHRASFV